MLKITTRSTIPVEDDDNDDDDSGIILLPTTTPTSSGSINYDGIIAEY